MTRGEPIARGRQAEVFAWDDGATPPRVLKLFFPQVGRAAVQWEMDIARAVSVATPLVPTTHGEVVELEGRFGIVYDRVDGASMFGLITSRPWRAFACGRSLAEAHAGLHRLKPTGLPRLKDRLERRIHHAAALSPEQRSWCLGTLDVLPNGDSLFHGDFHPGNVLVQRNSLAVEAVIDWPNAGTGDPLADVAQTQMLMGVGWRGLPHRRHRLLARFITSAISRAYITRYCELTGANTPGIALWQHVIAAARLDDNIPQERERLLEVVRAGMAQA